MNSTEASDAGTNEQRERANPPPEAQPAAPGQADAQVGTPDGAMDQHPPRPRRRRRRRRPAPGSPPASGNGGAESETAGAVAPMEEAAGEPADTAGAGEVDAGAGADGELGTSRTILRLRGRRRRRRPPGAGRLLPGTAEAGGTASAEASGTPDAPASDPAAAPRGAAASAAALPHGARSFSAPRRRRRHAPLSTGEQAAGDGAPSTAPAGDGARPVRPRRRRRPQVATEGAAPGIGQQQGERRPPRDDRERGARSRDDNRRDARGGGRRERDDRRGGRGRRDAPRPVERKIYSMDSVVDRGFDDVEEEGGETRRVHWTILKRTTADQISRKALAALYVLQRDGTDSEFPSLGAARDAVNKKITHPEKLTRSKAEHAAERKK